MSRVGVDRLNSGIAVSTGGGNGSGSSDFLTGQTIANGSSTITHTLGQEPKTVLFFNSSGQPVMVEWTANVTNPTTQIDVVNAMPQFTGATIELSA